MNQISREETRVLNTENIPHTNLHPLLIHPLPGIQHLYFGVVYLPIRLVPFDVLHHLLDCCDGEDDEKGDNGDIFSSGGHSRNLLKKTDRKEENIGIPSKLLEQKFWYE